MLSTEEMVESQEKVKCQYPLFPTPQEMKRLKSEIKGLRDQWREWLEDTYASDVPESLYDYLYHVPDSINDTDINTDLERYTEFEESYIKNVQFTLNVIESAKDSSYKPSVMPAYLIRGDERHKVAHYNG